jgi:hypothetical protein
MVDFEHMSPAGRAAWQRAAKRQAKVNLPAEDVRVRAENEDDDGYDPYSDYMDALARDSREKPEADPWR